jgi:hypothetical protein
MTNTARGETSFLAAGEKFVMRLTLGALAEIESAFNVASLSDLATRLKSFATSDIATVAAALLRAGGHDVTANDVLKLPVDLATIVQAVADVFALVNREASAASPLAGGGKGSPSALAT